jgi:hypothetical protein
VDRHNSNIAKALSIATICLFGFALSCITSVAAAWGNGRIDSNRNLWKQSSDDYTNGYFDLIQSGRLARFWISPGLPHRVVRAQEVDIWNTPKSVRNPTRGNLMQAHPTPPQSIMIISTGWPFLCFTCSVNRVSGQNAAIEYDENSGSIHSPGRVASAVPAQVYGGVCLTSRNYPRGNFDIVPIMPLWGGLCLNTIFFCIILLVTRFTCLRCYLLFLHHWRSCRSMCLKCGYPVPVTQHGYRCPECGSER